MSFWYGNGTEERPTSVGSGQAPLVELLDASSDHQVFVENSDSSYQALYRAYDDRIKAIQERTGETRQNPLYLAGRGGQVTPGFRRPSQGGFQSRSQAGTEVDDFNAWLAQITVRHPDAADVIKADVPLERDAEALARHMDERLAKAMASRDGAAKWAAVLAGGLQGSLYDPLQVITLFAGGGAGGAKTAIGRIGKVALQETAINGLSEALLQSEVQNWRKQAGLPNGLAEAMQNIGFAALAGGVLGSGMAAAGEAISRGFRPRDIESAAGELAKSPTVRPDVSEGLRGNGLKAIETLKPIRDTLPPEVRGAIDQADLIARDGLLMPRSATEPHHDLMIDRATRAALSNEPFVSEASAEQIARIVDRLMPATGGAAPAERSLQQFLASAGGVKDFKGELEALGIANASERFVGKLVKPDGIPLDQARRVAAEAGYFDHLYGTAENAMERSTVNDLLDTLDTAARSDVRVRGAEGERAYVETLVTDIAARAGPAVDDDLIVKAAELANAENLDPGTALDRVLIAIDQAGREAEEADRSAATFRQANTTEARSGLSDPAVIDDEALFTAADLEGLPEDYDIPFFDDGRTLTGAELMAEIEHHENLFQLVEACRA
ncbi:hypothetical protein [Rhizobium sp. PL01]|uniref:hypothetical protein n=1 Tax=Rhizobium sp. PL01 TaxID=3085631 RepID=UPI00298176C1|nr:hypothetical protein [Rhizobium sp. PL01]MDW5313724.1 hypothetical protein [Rhizobium sp. PL01]